jgi:hypothetical protein
MYVYERAGNASAASHRFILAVSGAQVAAGHRQID